MNAQTVLVIPCFNEAQRLPVQKLTTFVEEHPEIEFFLVNDGSRDNTMAVITDVARTCPGIKVLNLIANCGKAETVRQGILAVLKRAPRPARVGFWDADLATPLEEIPCFLHEMQRGPFQMVTGCRLTRLGAQVRRNLYRHYLGRVFATAVSNLLRLEVYDTQCGAKLFSSDLAEELFARPFKTKWLFDVELFRRVSLRYGRKKAADIIYEYPVRAWQEVRGSKLTCTHMLTVPLQLLKIFLSRN